MRYYFTSESVGVGHPDKICDQISDAILDAYAAEDRNCRTGIEVMAANRLIVIGGEVKSSVKIDVKEVAWQVLQKIGYTKDDYTIIDNINTQSSDINQGVELSESEVGAGDQGIMFGYATDETKEFLPLSLVISNELLKTCEKLRHSTLQDRIKSDMKSQVTVEIDDQKNTQKVTQVLLSIQHDKSASLSKLKNDIKKLVVDEVLKKYHQDTNVKFLFNPTGRFVIGGSIGDTGLTGRKIIADTYGGAARHGGGAFSGKDWTKVDRSAAYYARYVAKNLVAAKICKKIEIQLSYAIGLPEPQSIYINTFNSSKYSDEQILECIKSIFNFRVLSIINQLKLKYVEYSNTSTFGHFGKKGLPWEELDKVAEIKKYFKK